jgi:hypothetical protein
MAGSMPRSNLINNLAQSLGMEGATKVVNDACFAAGVASKENFANEEVLKICDVLKSKQGFIKIVAMTISTQIKLSGMMTK